MNERATGRDQDDSRNDHKRRGDDKYEVAGAHRGAVELVDALRVDELRAHLEPDQERSTPCPCAPCRGTRRGWRGCRPRRSGPRPTPTRAAAPGPRSSPRAATASPSSPSCDQPLHAGRTTVRVRMHDELGSAPQRLVGHRVHVADDDVGREPGLHDRVGSAVDADEHRAASRGCRASGRPGPA